MFPSKYEYNGSVTAAISIDGIEVGSEDDPAAVFVGDDCRGYKWIKSSI